MSEESNHYLTVGAEGASRRIAYRQTPRLRRDAPGLFWLNGFSSSMSSTKVSEVADWCRGNGLQLTRFDYSAHGDSSGTFIDATIGQWLEDSLAVFDELTAGPQIIVGSSMGGWLALRLIESLLQRAASEERRTIAGLALIAPALDMTERLIWRKLDERQKALLRRDGYLMRPDRYGGDDIPITSRLIDEGRRHVYGARGFAPGCPVRILHGLRDEIVPWQTSLDVAQLLQEEDIHLTLIKDGDHRLSKMSDIHCLLGIIEPLLAA